MYKTLIGKALGGINTRTSDSIDKLFSLINYMKPKRGIAGIVCNPEVYGGIKNRIMNMSKDPWTRVYERYNPILTICGVDIFIKVDQIEIYRMFYSFKTLHNYLSGGADNV